MRIAIFALIIVMVFSTVLYGEVIELGLSGTLFWSSQPLYEEEVGPGAYLTYVFHPGFKMQFGVEYFWSDGESVMSFSSSPDEDVPYSYDATMLALDVSILYNFLEHGYWSLWAGPCFNFNVLNGDVTDLRNDSKYSLVESKKTGFGAVVMLQTQLTYKVPLSLSVTGRYRYSSSDTMPGPFDKLFEKVTRSADVRLGISYGF